jgi:hypothetical protein
VSAARSDQEQGSTNSEQWKTRKGDVTIIPALPPTHLTKYTGRYQFHHVDSLCFRFQHLHDQSPIYYGNNMRFCEVAPLGLVSRCQVDRGKCCQLPGNSVLCEALVLCFRLYGVISQNTVPLIPS